MDFDNLRRFSSIPRAQTGTSYSVTAGKNTNATLKQLGVLALDANGNQIGETYYVVSPDLTTGHIPNASISSVQAMTNTTEIIQTFEEAICRYNSIRTILQHIDCILTRQTRQIIWVKRLI
ncbi:hypothetical protein [Chryseobacterium indoltheticum]|uniref:hypothetical protein n=1 Tax=Chryseobacterium indoltheticum TaxID=254 RepID=UPI003F495E64